MEKRLIIFVIVSIVVFAIFTMLLWWTDQGSIIFGIILCLILLIPQNFYADHLGKAMMDFLSLESTIPKIREYIWFIVGYCFVLYVMKSTFFLAPFYWSWKESDRFVMWHIGMCLLLFSITSMDAEYKNWKIILSISCIILLVSPMFLEKKTWNNIKKGTEWSYEIPEYGQQEWIYWHWKVDPATPYQVKYNDDKWYDSDKIPENYKYKGGKLYKINIRTKPIDEYFVKIQLWPKLTPN